MTEVSSAISQSIGVAEHILSKQLRTASPELAPLSIALGTFEHIFTTEGSSALWPAYYEVGVPATRAIAVSHFGSAPETIVHQLPFGDSVGADRCKSTQRCSFQPSRQLKLQSMFCVG